MLPPPTAQPTPGILASAPVPQPKAPLSTGLNHASEPEAHAADVQPEDPPVQEPEEQPVASRDFSPAKSVRESEAHADEAQNEEVPPPAVEAQQLAHESDVQIMNHSQELALQAAQQAGPSRPVLSFMPSPVAVRRTNRPCIPAQETDLEMNYPRETFPIFKGSSSSRHGPEFNMERHRSKLAFF